jgi:hypothetical protein
VEKASTTTSVSADPGPTNPGDPVTVSVTVSSPAGTPTGEVEIKANGSPSCTVSAPQGSCQVTPTSSGDITATYKGNDVFSSSASTTPHQVNEPPPPTNSPPVAQPDTYGTPTGQTLTIAAPGVLANDTDPDGNPLTAQVQTQPAQGGLVLMNSDGGFSYFPGTATGQDTFTYSISDGTASSTATVTINLQ